jgi:hypothetical protein
MVDEEPSWANEYARRDDVVELQPTPKLRPTSNNAKSFIVTSTATAVIWTRYGCSCAFRNFPAMIIL